MLIILFGYPGVGKNYVGNILRKVFGFFIYDGDSDLTSEVKTAIRNNEIVSENLRDRYFDYVFKKLRRLLKTHPKLVFIQALTKEKHRRLLSAYFPDARFIKIDAPARLMKKRLQHRKHLITPDYARKVRRYFEPIKIKHQRLINDGGSLRVIKQLHKIFGSEFDAIDLRQVEWAE